MWRRRVQDPGLHDGALTAALAAVRDVDEWHLYQTGLLAQEFAARTRPGGAACRWPGTAARWPRSWPTVAVLAIAGGHVGVLMECLETFGVAPLLTSNRRPPLVAWSAGAMVLAEVIVLFADDAPQGNGHPEIYRSGLGVVRKLIPLPHARRRLQLGRPGPGVRAGRSLPRVHLRDLRRRGPGGHAGRRRRARADCPD